MRLCAGNAENANSIVRQGIAVRKELKQVVRHMENPVYKVIAFFAKGLFKK